MKLMYITNRPEVAKIAQDAGVDWIFVDLETVGKQARQGGMDTVQSKHTVADVAALRLYVKAGGLLVRVNPIYEGSQAEINAVIAAGADIIMLPYFKTKEEVAAFLGFVGGRCRTMLLFETPEAADLAADIAAMDGVEFCYIGLNDLHLGYGMRFMFQLLADGTVEKLCGIFRKAGKPYGFGGIARIGGGALPAEAVLGEHVRLGSQAVIVSRSFCNADKESLESMEDIFGRELPKLRSCIAGWRSADEEALEDNRRRVVRGVDAVLEKLS